MVKRICCIMTQHVGAHVSLCSPHWTFTEDSTYKGQEEHREKGPSMPVQGLRAKNNSNISQGNQK